MWAEKERCHRPLLLLLSPFLPPSYLSLSLFLYHLWHEELGTTQICKCQAGFILSLLYVCVIVRACVCVGVLGFYAMMKLTCIYGVFKSIRVNHCLPQHFLNVRLIITHPGIDDASKKTTSYLFFPTLSYQ